MRLKFNRNSPLEIIGIGEFSFGDIVIADDPAKAKKYLDSGYFDIVKEKKKRKRKKSKKKGVDKLCHKDQEDI
ncbi:unnamed protein product [marine sediment metagenome]|uniref:Uncharacterized protein n=1 Tax=marine sediment metagenome TaxID=412755 RepID=X0V3X8_9ZZZZ